MKVAVIGGTGNISTSVVRLLLESGHDVTCFNRGVAKRESEPHLRTIVCDRYDRARFEQLASAQGFDAAVDFICFTAEDARSSLRAFRGVSHFIHTSTVRTYGRLLWIPASEDHPIRPDTLYGQQKAEADAVFLGEYWQAGFPVTIFKPSTTYGPQRIVRQLGLDSSWLRRIAARKPILILGDGEVCHQFLHVDDAARAYVGALESPQTVGQVYNLVNPSPIDWRQYHQAAMRVIGAEVDQVGVPTEVLARVGSDRFELAAGVFSRNSFYESCKIARDIPAFAALTSLEWGIGQIIDYLDHNDDGSMRWDDDWEDQLIAQLRSIRIRHSAEPRHR